MKAQNIPSAGVRAERACMDYSYGIMREPRKETVERSRVLERKRLARREVQPGWGCLPHHSPWLCPLPSKHSIMISSQTLSMPYI